MRLAHEAAGPPRRDAGQHDANSGSSDEHERRVRARRFDADRRDEVLAFEDALASRPTGRQLLWIDIADAPRPDEVSALAETFALDPRTVRGLGERGGRPHLTLHGEYVHVRVAAEPNANRPDRSPWLDVIVAPNVVISCHFEPVRFLDGLDERIEADTTIGLLDSATFGATILDAAVTTYLKAVDSIEDEVDRLDARSLADTGRNELLGELVALRRRIARLRRLLTDHREVFAALATADFAHAAGSPDGGDVRSLFGAVAGRFEGAIGAVEDSRDVLLGSFDVFMTRTAQRTNDVMKVLALATVLLLPGSLIAGLLGMNVAVPVPNDNPIVFWLVVAGVVLLATVVLVAARVRGWL